MTEYLFRLAELSFGTALRQHHSQRNRKSVGSNHKEAGIKCIGVRIIAHSRIAHDMIHRNLEKKSDGLNQQIGNSQNEHAGKKQLGTAFHTGFFARLRVILQIVILLYSISSEEFAVQGILTQTIR